MKLRYLFILLIILAVTSVFIGVEDLSPLDLFDLSKQEASTLFASRLPRLISIVIAGLSMSICGLIMQQISRNKFVSPTTAGTMDWARLGILISLLLFTSASPLIKMLVAFVFALAGNFLFMKILERIKFNDTIFIPLVGLMLGNIVSSIATFIAYKYDLIQNVSSWLQGDFSLVVKGRYELLYLSIPLVIIAYVYADKFTLAGMGESFSVNLGLKYKRVVNIENHYRVPDHVPCYFDCRYAAVSRFNHPEYCIDLQRRQSEEQPAAYCAVGSGFCAVLRYTGQNHYLPL